MSNTSAPAFKLKPPDEATELRALTNSIDFAEGFTLLFARCNQTELRKRLIAEIRTRLPNYTIQELNFSGQELRHLLDTLRQGISEPPPDAIFVYGLETTLPVAAEAYRTPFVANLNAARNSFSRYIPCPLVFWVPDYVITAISRGAPDFFSVRSGVYYFTAHPLNSFETEKVLTGGEEWTAEALSIEEKNERILHIEQLLHDYRMLPSNQRDTGAEARLLNRLGHFYLSIGAWERAEAAIKECLSIAEQKDDYLNQGALLTNLGVLYQRQGRLQDAERSYQQGLELMRQVNDKRGEALALYNLAGVYFVLQQWKKAETIYASCLEAFQRTGEQIGIALAIASLADVYIQQEQLDKAETMLRQTLFYVQQVNNQNVNNPIVEEKVYQILGEVYQKKEQWSEAEQAYNHCLSIQQKLGNVYGKEETLLNLGVIYLNQGRLEQANTVFNEVLSSARTLGNHINEGRSLEKIAAVNVMQGNFEAGLEKLKEALNAFELTEDRTSQEEIRQVVTEIEKELDNESEVK